MKDLNLKRVATLRFQKENNFKKIIKFKFFKNKNEWEFAGNKKCFNKTCTPEEQDIANKYFLIIKKQLNFI